MPKNKIGQELEAISTVLDDNRQIVDLVYKDLIGQRQANTGRLGLSAEQVLRCAVLKQYRQLTYEELAFHLDDSASFRAFARLKMGQYPSASTLQENIRAITPATWEAMHRLLLQYAAQRQVEKGRTVRIDATAVAANIHPPTDSTLLQDGIRVLTRLLLEGKTLLPVPQYKVVDHNRAAKRRVLEIMHTKKETVRLRAYRELLRLADKVKGYALEAIACLHTFTGADRDQTLSARILAAELESMLSRFHKVVDQTQRRVVQGEKVPAQAKIVSLFECHADVIVKGGRDTQYGHKVFLSVGRSGLILDCLVPRGNPADTTLYPSLLARQVELYQRLPRQVAADGGFASRENLAAAQRLGVKDAMFAKKRGLQILDMVKSLWVYQKLRNFRAGIEAAISRLKCRFGLDRCTWTGWLGFQQYVWSTVFAYNVLVMGRLLAQLR
jgi:IS5 family transposase